MPPLPVLPTFRKAAAKLGISQPTLTSQIVAMEEALEVQLFERSRAGTLLSPEGRELLPLVRDILEQYQNLMETANHTNRDMGGTFKLGVSDSIGPLFTTPIVTCSASALPKTSTAPQGR